MSLVLSFAFAFSANAQISATYSPILADMEYCTSVGTTSQSFTVTATTGCSTNPNALSYQWWIKSGAAWTTLGVSGAGYNSANAAIINITDLQAMTAAFPILYGDSLRCIVKETAGGCNDIDTLKVVQFLPITAAPTISLSGDLSVCQGEEVQWNLNVTAPNTTGNLTVSWLRTFDAGGSSPTTHFLNDRDPAATAIDTFLKYTTILADDQDVITVSVENVCGSVSAGPSTLTVSPIPQLSIPSTTLSACETTGPKNIDYTISNAVMDPSTGGSVNWTLVTTVTGSDAPTVVLLQAYMNLAAQSTGTGNGTITRDIDAAGVLAPGTYTITFNTITKDLGSPAGTPACPRALTNQKIDITIYPEPVVSFSAPTLDLCEGSVVSFDVQITNAEYGAGPTGVNWTYTFTETGGAVSAACAGGAATGLLSTPSDNGNTTQSIDVSGLTPGMYVITLNGITNTTDGCVGTVGAVPSITINVYPKPLAVLSTTAQSVCEGSTGAFDLTVSNAEFCSAIGVVSDADWDITYSDAAVSDAIVIIAGGSNATNLLGLGNQVYNLTSNVGVALTAGSYDFDMTNITTVAPNPTTVCAQALATDNTYTLTVNPTPTMVAAITDATICEGVSGESLDITVSNAMLGGVAQDWEIAYTEVARTVTSSSCGAAVTTGLLPSPVVTGSGNGVTNFAIPSNWAPGQYQFEFTQITNTSATCAAAMAAQVVTFEIDPIPVVGFVPDIKEMCEESVGETFDINVTNAFQCNSATVNGSTDINWSLTIDDADGVDIAALNPVVGTGDGTSTVTIDNTLPVNTHYYISDIRSNTTHTCSSSDNDTFTIIVEPKPVITFVVASQEVCEATPGHFVEVDITNAVLDGVGQNWQVDFTESSSNVAGGCVADTDTSNVLGSTGMFFGVGNQTGASTLKFAIPTTLAPGAYTFTLTQITNTDGPCSGKLPIAIATHTLIVNPKPLVSIIELADSVCEGASTTFDIVVTNAERCAALGGAVTDVDWDFTFIDNVDSDIAAILAVPGAKTGNQTHTITANNTPVLTTGPHLFTISTATTTSLVVNCDSAQTDTFTLYVNPNPVAAWSVPNPLNLCEHNLDSFYIEISNAEVAHSGVIDSFDWSLTFTELSGNLNTACVSASGAEGAIPGLTSSPITGTGNRMGANRLKFYVPANTNPGQYTFTMTGITNTTSPCVGTITAPATMVINVRPQPVASLAPDSAWICEEDQPTFDITVTNSQYCSAVDVASINSDWTLIFNDPAVGGVHANIASPLVVSGNSVETVTANVPSPPGLTAGVYEFDMISIQNTTAGAGCLNPVDVTGDSLYTLTVHPKPEVEFSTSALTVCEGTDASFTMDITNSMLGATEIAHTILVSEVSGNVGSACAAGVTQGIVATSNSSTGDTTYNYSLGTSLAPGIYTYEITAITTTGLTPNCTGVILATDKITIRVNPKPIVGYSVDTVKICENTQGNFDIVVTNAEHCPSIGGGLANINWSIAYSENADANLPAVFTGTGNQAGLSYMVNITPTLTVGDYSIDIDNIMNTTHTCINDFDTSLIVRVKDLPNLVINSYTTPVCNGSYSTVDYDVTGVIAGQAWEFTYSIGGAFTTISGTGPVAAAIFAAGPFNVSGVRNITFTAIVNTGPVPNCTGNLVGPLVVNVLDNPDVTSLSMTGPIEVCSQNTIDFDITVSNSPALAWKVYYNIDGTVDSTTGVGNGIHTVTTATQVHADINGAFDNRTISIDSIKWTVAPFCSNIAVGAADVTFDVKPLPGIVIGADSSVCVNTPVTVTYTVDSVRAGDSWLFQWTSTSPAQGPVNEGPGVGITTGTFTTLPLTPIGSTDITITSLINASTGCVQTVLPDSTVMIDAPSNAGTIFQNYTLCEDDPTVNPIYVTGSVGVVTWDSSDNDGFTYYTTPHVGDSFTFQYPKLTHRWKAFAINGACPEDSTGEIIVFVHPKPKYDIIAIDNEVCKGTDPTVTISVTNVPASQAWVLTFDTTAINGTFTDQGSGTFVRTLTGYGNVSGVKTINFTHIVNNTSGCDTTYTVTENIEVKELPTAGTVNGPAILCNGSDATYVWTPGIGAVDRWEVSTNGPTGSWTTYTPASVNQLVLSNNLDTTWVRAIITNSPCSQEDTSAMFITVVLPANPLAQFVSLSPTYIYCEDATKTDTLRIQISNTSGADWSIEILEGASTSAHTMTGTGDGFVTYTTQVGSMLSDFDVVIKSISLTSIAPPCTKFLGNTSTVSFQIIEDVNATLTTVADSLCHNDAVNFTFSVTGVPAADDWELWYKLQGTAQTSLTGTGSGTFTRTASSNVTNATGAFIDIKLELDSVKNTDATNSAGMICLNTLTDEQTIRVFPATVAGTSAAYSAAECTGINSGTVGVDGEIGAIQRWQVSTNLGVTWSNIAVTTDPLPYSNLTVETWYRAVIKSGVCGELTSIEAKITIEPTPEVVITNTKPTLVCENGDVLLAVTVTNTTAVAGSDWKIFYTVDGVLDSLAGSGDGNFTDNISGISQDVTVKLVSIVTSGANGMKCNNMSLTEELEIDVIDLPTATVGSISALCTGNTVNYSVIVSNVSATDNWSLVVKLDNNATETVTGTGPGTYNFTTAAMTNNVSATTGAEMDSLFLLSITNAGTAPTTGAACNRINLDTAIINVYPVSDANTATASSTSICSGEGVNLIANASIVGTIVRWEYSTNGGTTWTAINSSATTPFAVSNITVTTNYRVVVKSGPCTEDESVMVTVVVEPTPDVVITNTKPTLVCENGDVLLAVTVTNTTAVTGSDWKIFYTVDGVLDSLAGSGDGSFTDNISGISQDVTVKLVSIVSSGGNGMKCNNMSLTDELEIDVIDLPTATVGSISALCTGNTVNYSVIVNNVSSTDNWTLVVKLDNNATETVTGTGAGTYNFTTTAMTNNVSATTGAEMDSLFLLSITNTTTTPTTGSACNNINLDTAIINVYPVSDAGTAEASSVLICSGDGVTLDTMGTMVGEVVRWEYSTNGGTTWTAINSSTTTPFMVNNIIVNTHYRVVVMSGPCAEAESVPVLVEVAPIPAVVINNAKPTLVCVNGTVILEVTVSNITTGAGDDWTINYTVDGADSTMSESGNGTFTNPINGITQDATVRLVSIVRNTSSGTGMKCVNLSLTDQLEIDVIDLPTATIGSISDICTGNTVNYSVNVSDVTSSDNWTLVVRLDNNSTETVSGTGAGTFNFTTTATTDNSSTAVQTDSLFLLSITNTTTTPTTGAACNNVNLDTALIQVYPVSDAKIATASSTSICSGEGVNLIADASIVGTIVRWEYSTNGGTTWTAINSSATTPFAVSNITATTNYRVVVMSGPCAEDESVMVTVVVEPTPDVVITNAKPTTICKGDVVVLAVTVSNTTNGGSGNNWTINYTVDGTAASMTGAGNGNFTQSLGAIGVDTEVELVSIVTRGAAGMKCDNTNLSDKFEIKVNDIPTATITSSMDTVCNGSTANVLVAVDNVKVGETWTITYDVTPGSSGLSKTGVGPGSFTITTPVLTTGTTYSSYSVKLTNIVNGSLTPSCSDPLDSTVVIAVAPTTVGGTITPAASVGCYGNNSGTLTLSGHIGNIQEWEYSTDGGSTWTVTSNNAPTLSYLNLTETTMYRVYVKSGPCAGMYSSTATVTILPQPVATISGSPKVCPNESAVFTVTVTNVPTGNGWSLEFTENGSSKTLAGTGSGTFDLTTAGYPYTTTPSTITVTLDAITNLVTGCRNEDLNSTAVAIITPNPVAEFTAADACQDSLVSFLNLSSIVEGTVAGYKWYFGDGDSSLAVSPQHAYASPGTYTVRLIAYSDNGCTGEVTHTVTVHDVPVADYTFTNVCKNEIFTPTNTSSIANGTIVGYAWDFGDNTTSTLENPTHSYASSGNYPVTLTVTSNNGCSNSVTKEVTIYVLPDADFAADPVCEGDDMSFVNGSAVPYGSMTYSWDFSGQGSSIETNPKFTFTGNGQFNVKLIATTNNGCMDSVTNVVTVWPKPVAAFSVPDVCIGETSIFANASTVSSGTIDENFWTFGDATFSTGDNPTHKYATVNEPGHSVTLRVVTDKGCTDEVTGPAIVWSLPIVSVTADEDAFCDGDSTIVIATSNQSNSNFDWNTGETTASITVNKQGWYVVEVTGDPARGACKNSDSTFVTVWANPIADAGRDTSIDKGQSVVLQGSGGEFYFWSTIDIPTFLLSDNEARPTAFEMLDTREYILLVTDTNGCTDLDSVLVTVIDGFVLHPYNVITPNGDGKNDTWIIDNITAYPEAEVAVFNRYGMEIFKRTGYVNDWDGTYDGKELPDGAYYYLVTLPGSDKDPYTGVINLIRSGK